MSTLTEIRAAADALSVEQKKQLLLFLASRSRAVGAKLPEPHQFSADEIAGWIAEDEADMQQIRKQP